MGNVKRSFAPVMFIVTPEGWNICGTILAADPFVLYLSAREMQESPSRLQRSALTPAQLCPHAS